MSKLVKTYKYKIKTNKEIEQKINSWIGACRVVYNLALEVRKVAYSSRGKTISKFELINQLPELKKEIDWIKDVPSQAVQEAVERMDKSYQNFFKGAGFPKWAKKGMYNSMVVKQGIEFSEKKIKLPKLGWVGFFNSRNIPKEGKIKQGVLKKEADGFYICLAVEIANTKINQKPTCENQAVGIDMGVRYFYSTSDGVQVENPRVLKSFERQLRVEKRALSRKKKGSKNREKQRDRLSKVYLKIARVRQDFSHKQSTALVSKYDFLAVEDLKLKNMSKSAKGTVEKPGKNIKQKSGLNKAILDVGMGIFLEQIKYKSEWQGKQFFKVDPKYTSQCCSKCEHTDKENRKSQAVFECTQCSHQENADINAAKNILARTKARPRKAQAVA